MLQHDKPQKHYAKWKELDAKEHILYDLIYTKISKKENLWTQKVDLCSLVLRVRAGLTTNRHKERFRVIEI